MSKVTTYIRESYEELIQKVTWPKYSELQSSTLLVAVASVIISLLIYAMDYSFSNLLSVFYSFFK
jgi:preprotein translocase subunit SecE